MLTNPKVSELGRFAVTESLDEIGAFKTSTLRNVAVTAPFMHDGSLKTLRDVVDHYNNGGVTNKNDPVNDFLSGGIRPLNLTDDEISDLVAFLESLTSPQFAAQKTAAASCNVKTTTVLQQFPRLEPRPNIARQRRRRHAAMNIKYDRRSFLKTSTLTVGAAALPMTLVELAFAKPSENFTFAYISDSHIQQIKGTQFVRNWDRGLIRAVAETNLLTPKPDFVMFGGDLAQMG